MENRTQSLTIKQASVSDLQHALTSGLQDFKKAPGFGLFFGAFYAIGGLLLTYGVFVADLPWLAYPLVIGFALIGPFVATGLYEVSRVFEKEGRPDWRSVLGVIWFQHQREFGWMAFVMLFIFWIWIYQIRTLVAVFFGFSGFADISGFLDVVFTTSNGWTFLAVGHLVGAIISLILFMLTVISCPLLLDRDIDFVTAMVTSIRTVVKSPVVMLGWGVFVILAVIVSAIPAFFGLLFSLPILGHATWHLYRRLIS